MAPTCQGLYAAGGARDVSLRLHGIHRLPPTGHSCRWLSPTKGHRESVIVALDNTPGDAACVASSMPTGSCSSPPPQPSPRPMRSTLATTEGVAIEVAPLRQVLREVSSLTCNRQNKKPLGLPVACRRRAGATRWSPTSSHVSRSFGFVTWYDMCARAPHCCAGDLFEGSSSREQGLDESTYVTCANRDVAPGASMTGRLRRVLVQRPKAPAVTACS